MLSDQDVIEDKITSINLDEEINNLCIISLKNELNNLNIDSLKNLCKVNMLTCYSKLNKQDLINLLINGLSSVIKKNTDDLKSTWLFLLTKNIDDLKSLCKSYNIKGYSRCKKDDIMLLLLNYHSECKNNEFIKKYTDYITIGILKISKNSFNNYEHLDTHLVFNNEKKVYGYQKLDGSLLSLNSEHILTCNKYNFDYINIIDNNESDELKKIKEELELKELQRMSEELELKELQRKKEELELKELQRKKEELELKELQRKREELELQRKNEELELKELQKKEELELKEPQKKEELKVKDKKKQIIPKSVKTHVWDLYIGSHINEHRCLCCKKTLIKNTFFEVGHVISERDGGTLEISNLRPICSVCNHSMGTINMIEFVKKYGYFIG